MKNFWKVIMVFIGVFVTGITLLDLIELIFLQEKPSYGMIILWGFAMLFVIVSGLVINILDLIESNKKSVK